MQYHHSLSLTFNVTRMQYVKDHILFIVMRQGWTVPNCQNDNWEPSNTASGYVEI